MHSVLTRPSTKTRFEGVIGMDVDGFHILMDGGARVVVVVDKAGSL